MRMTGIVNKDVTVDTSNYKVRSLLVIGGTSGLGQAIALDAAAKGAQVTVVGRSFKDDPEKIKFIKCDLSLMKEAKRLGETVPTADVVVLTTGILGTLTVRACRF
jgi:NAD(P)-dependent dehydrogenase (short-subunit alcohol dehydrogenase family)